MAPMFPGVKVESGEKEKKKKKKTFECNILVEQQSMSKGRRLFVVW